MESPSLYKYSKKLDDDVLNYLRDAMYRPAWDEEMQNLFVIYVRFILAPQQTRTVVKRIPLIMKSDSGNRTTDHMQWMP